MKILVSTIMRDMARNVDFYHSQLKEFCANTSHEIYISIYENDSRDQTALKVNMLDWSFADGFVFKSEQINTRSYGSVVSKDRVKNLGEARMNSICCKYFKDMDRILVLEPDVLYEPQKLHELINFEERTGQKFDIVSMVSYKHGWSRDTWAVRKTIDEYQFGQLHENWMETNYDRYYSTFNGICYYNAEAFHRGAKFHWENPRTKDFDCDTAVVCEWFHQLGFDKIFIDHTLLCTHYAPSISMPHARWLKDIENIR